MVKSDIRQALLSSRNIPGAFLFTLLLLVGCAQQSDTPKPTGATNSDWPLHGLTHSEQRYSPLNQINESNVAKLSLAWYLDLPEPRGQEATPLVINGVMYTSAAWSVVFALDAKSGKELWRFDPQVDKSWAVKGCCDAVNRGVAFWENRIYVGTLDGRLIAIDANTGKQIWSVLTIDPDKNYSITGAPRIANGKVFIGNGGAEFGVRGYISAYDTDKGELLWRFYTVPGDPSLPFENEILAKAAETWHGHWWKLGGGGTVWDSMAYDPELNLLYFGVGNGSPWNPNLRSDGKGDNLFLSSIIAVNADSGEYAWHYQTTPGEGWDYTATQHLMLAELEIDGETRKVIMQAPKNGFFYVLDRATGEFISGNNFVPVTWASGIDGNGRPMINPEAKYWESGEAVLQSPAFLGGHNWHPMSFNPNTGLVYFAAQELAFPYKADNELEIKKLAVNLGIDTSIAGMPDDPKVIQAIKDASKGHLTAWDPIQQKEIWRVQYPGPWNGGTLATAGNLVFQGSAAGFLNAYHTGDGKQLWQFPTQTGIVAPPISYSINGEQYISVMAGWGGIFPLITGPLAHISAEPINRSRILTFKIGGNAKLPEPQEQIRDLPQIADAEPDAETIKYGFLTYDRFCAGCHGAGAIGGGVVPDLRYSPFLSSPEGWQNVVVKGALKTRGMAAFGDEVSDKDAEAVRQFVISRNRFAHRIGDTQRLSR